jgi:hypothetical protein
MLGYLDKPRTLIQCHDLMAVTFYSKVLFNYTSDDLWDCAFDVVEEALDRVGVSPDDQQFCLWSLSEALIGGLETASFTWNELPVVAERLFGKVRPRPTPITFKPAVERLETIKSQLTTDLFEAVQRETNLYGWDASVMVFWIADEGGQSIPQILAEQFRNKRRSHPVAVHGLFTALHHLVNEMYNADHGRKLDEQELIKWLPDWVMPCVAIRMVREVARHQALASDAQYMKELADACSVSPDKYLVYLQVRQVNVLGGPIRFHIQQLGFASDRSLVNIQVSTALSSQSDVDLYMAGHFVGRVNIKGLRLGNIRRDQLTIPDWLGFPCLMEPTKPIIVTYDIRLSGLARAVPAAPVIDLVSAKDLPSCIAEPVCVCLPFSDLEVLVSEGRCLTPVNVTWSALAADLRLLIGCIRQQGAGRFGGPETGSFTVDLNKGQSVYFRRCRALFVRDLVTAISIRWRPQYCDTHDFAVAGIVLVLSDALPSVRFQQLVDMLSEVEDEFKRVIVPVPLFNNVASFDEVCADIAHADLTIHFDFVGLPSLATLVRQVAQPAIGNAEFPYAVGFGLAAAEREIFQYKGIPHQRAVRPKPYTVLVELHKGMTLDVALAQLNLAGHFGKSGLSADRLTQVLPVAYGQLLPAMDKALMARRLPIGVPADMEVMDWPQYAAVCQREGPRSVVDFESITHNQGFVDGEVSDDEFEYELSCPGATDDGSFLDVDRESSSAVLGAPEIANYFRTRAEDAFRAAISEGKKIQSAEIAAFSGGVWYLVFRPGETPFRFSQPPERLQSKGNKLVALPVGGFIMPEPSTRVLHAEAKAGLHVGRGGRGLFSTPTVAGAVHGVVAPVMRIPPI